MSKIDELIQKFCPEGVEYMQLGAIEDAGLIKLGRGNVISKKDIAIEPGDYPIYSSSASGIGEFGRYGRYMFDDERLSWSVDGGGRFFYRHAHKYSVTNVSGWLKVLDSSRIDIKYLFYALDSAWSTKKFDYTKKAHPSVIRIEYKIPMPPLEVQKEIVNILDKFTQLESELSSELSSELEARRKQYEYYRNQLLTFDNNVDVKKLHQISEIYDSLHQTPRYSSEGYPMIRVTDIKGGYVDTDITLKVDREIYEIFTKKYKPQFNDIVVSRVGSYGNFSLIGDAGDVCLGQNTAIMHPLINAKYLYYALHSSKVTQFIESNVGGGSQKTISLATIKEIPIHVPSPEEQTRIVEILDKFDSLTNSISKGLPAEIHTRRQQYEYYRTKLLTFQEIPA